MKQALAFLPVKTADEVLDFALLPAEPAPETHTAPETQPQKKKLPPPTYRTPGGRAGEYQ